MRPIERVEAWFRDRVRKEGVARDALLSGLGAPPWMRVRPEGEHFLATISPSIVYAACTMAGPMGLSEPYLPELAVLVSRASQAENDTAFSREVRRFFCVVDTILRVLVPAALRGLNHDSTASKLVGLSQLRDEQTFYELFNVLVDATADFGTARDFEKQATNLELGLRVRGVGLGLTAVQHAKWVLDHGCIPGESFPRLRTVYSNLPIVIAAARRVPGNEHMVDAALIAMLRKLVDVDSSLFAREVAALERAEEKFAAKDAAN